MPSLSRRQPSLNLRQSALRSSAASSTRSSFESNDSSVDRFWAVKAASSEEMDFPIKKLASLPSRQKKQSNSLGLSIKPELHDVYQSSEEEASPNLEEVDWTSSNEDDADDFDEAPETSKPHHCSEPIISFDGACDMDTEDNLDTEICSCHIAFAVHLPITAWHKPRLIDIPAPTFRLKRSKAINRKSSTPHSARPSRPVRKQSLTPQALADVPGLDPDTDNSNKVSAPSSTYSEDFGSQPVTPLTSIHPSIRSPQQASSPSGYTSLLPPLEDSPMTPSPRRRNPKATGPRAKAVPAIDAPQQFLRKKESTTWQSVADTFSRARKATVSGLASQSREDLGYYSSNIPRSKTGVEGGNIKSPIGHLSSLASYVPPLPAANHYPSQLSVSNKPKTKMVARGAAERQEFVLPDFLFNDP